MDPGFYPEITQPRRTDRATASSYGLWPRPRQPHDPVPLVPGPANPSFRAIPSPEVTEPICRLPLLTLIYSPEAVNLGDLMRLSVRLGSIMSHLPRVFKGRPPNLDAPKDWSTLPIFPYPISIQDHSRVREPSNRTDISAQTDGRRPRVRLRYRDLTSKVGGC